MTTDEHTHRWTAETPAPNYTRWCCSKDGCYQTRITRGMEEQPEGGKGFRDLAESLERGDVVRYTYTAKRSGDTREATGTVAKSNRGGIRILSANGKRLNVVKTGWTITGTHPDGGSLRTDTKLGRGVQIERTGETRPITYKQRAGWSHTDEAEA